MNLQNVTKVAEHLLVEFGDDGPREMAARAAANREGGDEEAAVFWDQVGRAMEQLLANRDLLVSDSRFTVLPDLAFRHAIDASPNAYLLLYPDLVIAAANPEYLALTTRSKDIVRRGSFRGVPRSPGPRGGRRRR